MTMVTKTVNGKLMIVNKGERDEFLKSWPNHKILWIAQVEAEGTTRSQQSYYFNKIVPDFRNLYRSAGYQYTFQQMDQALLKLFYAAHIEKHSEKYGGFYTEDYKNMYTMSKHEAIEYLDFLRRLAAEEFDVIIEDPRRL